MKKLALNPEQLRVQSFATDAPPAGRGTVAGHGTVLDTCQTDPACCGTALRMQSCMSSCTDVDVCPVF
jgi:hypothetical protein